MKSTITKLLMTAVSVVAMGAAAHAQSAPANTVSNILDGADPGTISVAGITVYGVIDVGGVYNSQNTRAQSGSFYAGNEYPISKNGNSGRWDYQNNALSQSLIGFKGSQSLQALSEGLRGWSVGFDLQIGFDPLYGQVADVAKTLRQNNGVALANQTSNADGSRYGQVFNGEAYASLKNDVLGELRFGRQNTLLLSTLASYDAVAGSYGYSAFAYFGGYGGGAGVTNDARWNNALKYTNTIGPVRVGAAYRFDGGGQGGDSWSVQGGVDLPGALKGLSVDGVYAHENSAILMSSLSAANCNTLLGANAGNCGSLNLLNATVADTDTWTLAAKYKFNEGSMLSGATIMGGYEHIVVSNPTGGPLTNLNSEGYSIYTTNYNAFTTDKTLDVTWIGTRYQFTPKLSGGASWYHVEQNSFLSGGTAAKNGCNGLSGIAASSTCAGSFNWYSAMLDYQATKRMDFYGGVTFSDVSNGLASGFLHTNSYDVSFGTRFRF